MRGMSLLQMAGGVAMAGVVAAGTTAFTGPAGFTNSVANAKTFVGGSGTHTVVGADLQSFSATVNTGVSPTRISAFVVTFTADTPTGSTVTITPSGTPGGLTAGNATPDNFYCTTTNGSYQSTCTVGTSAADAGGYFTGVGSLTIKVV